jgi:hypothetical protein
MDADAEQVSPPGRNVMRTRLEAEDLVESLIQAHWDYEQSGPNSLNILREKYLAWKELVISALHTND